jgi:hypothetical protein
MSQASLPLFLHHESGRGSGDHYLDQYTFEKRALDHLNVTGTLILMSVLCESVSQAGHTVTIEWLILYEMVALFEPYGDSAAHEGLAAILTYTVLLPSLELRYSYNSSAVPRW